MHGWVDRQVITHATTCLKGLTNSKPRSVLGPVTNRRINDPSGEHDVTGDVLGNANAPHTKPQIDELCEICVTRSR